MLKTIVFITLFGIVLTRNNDINVTVRFKVREGMFNTKFTHFWKSSGFCPPDPKSEIYKWLLSEDVKMNLVFLGALPQRGIRYIRIHWLLNLIKIKSLPNKELVYDFTHLDIFLKLLHEQSLKPVFELMGYNTNDTYVEKSPVYWYQTTKKILENSFCAFGKRKVSKWRFETWNEPDLAMYNVLHFTKSEYLSYVNACASGLRDAFLRSNYLDSIPKLAGPAGLFKDKQDHPLCWGLLERCDSIESNGCPIQYISFHRKGNGSAEQLLNNSILLLDDIYTKYRNLRHLPLANDEADILTEWSTSEEWRGDVRYAAMVAKVVIDYYKTLFIKRNFKIEMLSNDNGFLNYHPYYFTQRTLMTRFQMNNTHPPHIQFVKKPVYSVMGLLSLLGDEFIEVDSKTVDPLVTVLVSRSRTHKFVAMVIAYANNTTENPKYTKRVHVTFRNENTDRSKYVVYLLDNNRTNPFLLWKEHGSPAFPEASLRKLMRNVQEPFRVVDPIDIHGHSFQVRLNLSLPSVALIHVCSMFDYPGKVNRLRAYNVTWNEVLLVWKDHRVKTRCIRTYEVEYASAGNNSTFERINSEDTIFLTFHYAANGGNGKHDSEKTIGRYRVRAVDYWKRKGEYSSIRHYPFP